MTTGQGKEAFTDLMRKTVVDFEVLIDQILIVSVGLVSHLCCLHPSQSCLGYYLLLQNNNGATSHPPLTDIQQQREHKTGLYLKRIGCM